MHVVSVINNKGGVGKTTLVANLAAVLAAMNNKVLLIDLDVQASLTLSFISESIWQHTDNSHTIMQAFSPKGISSEHPPGNQVTYPTNITKLLSDRDIEGRIGLIPSHPKLSNIDLDLSMTAASESLLFSLLKPWENYQILTNFLSYFMDDYDVALIDCPPNLSMLTKNALVASETALIPVKPDYLSSIGLSRLIGKIKTLQDEFNLISSAMKSQGKPFIINKLGLVFSMVEYFNGMPIDSQWQNIHEVSNKCKTQFPSVQIFANYLKQNNNFFANASKEGIPVALGKYSDQYHLEMQEELWGLASELSDFLGL